MPDSDVAYEVELSNWFVAYDCQFDADGNLLMSERDEHPLDEQE